MLAQRFWKVKGVFRERYCVGSWARGHEKP